jgi:uncharacterized membrane protein
MKFKWIIKFKKYEIPVIGIIIFLIITIWSLGMILAPLTLPPNSVEDLTGTVGPVENANITGNMNSYARFYYQAGDVNCHTKVERSFFINGNQMPFCARDVAIFFGMVIGMGIVLFVRFPIKLWWIVGGLVPIGLDGGLQLITSYESNNLFRVITGTLAGAVTMLALGYVIYDVSKDMQLKRQIKKESEEFPNVMEESIENHDPIHEPEEDLKEPNQDIEEKEDKKDNEN